MQKIEYTLNILVKNNKVRSSEIETISKSIGIADNDKAIQMSKDIANKYFKRLILDSDFNSGEGKVKVSHVIRNKSMEISYKILSSAGFNEES
jgi:hypothetical protein